MDIKVLLDNIERRLKAKKVSGHAISQKAKRPDAIRNLRRYVSGDLDGSWSLDILFDVAEALELPPWELLRPPGDVPKDAEFRDYVRELIDEQFAAREQPSPMRKRKVR